MKSLRDKGYRIKNRSVEMINFGFSNIIEEKIYIKNIPVIILTPKNEDNDIATIVLYHGWSSSKETQRMRGFIL